MQPIRARRPPVLAIVFRRKRGMFMSTTAPHGGPVGFGGRTRRRDRSRHGVSGLLLMAAGAFGVVGGCPPAPTAAETITLDVSFDRTGTLERDGAFTSMLSSPFLVVGDDFINKAQCGFISINLNSLPATANVSRVELRFDADVLGGNPFGDFVRLSVHHVNVVSGIDAGDFNGTRLRSGVATITALSGPRDGNGRQRVTIDVTTEVNADRTAGRPISSFQLIFGEAPACPTTF
ncbi:MAG: hypothetical protein SF069_03320 [Phycisphaerae bacterium]|nr:hypothetical protein [Phycisphaerae bacterium]